MTPREKLARVILMARFPSSPDVVDMIMHGANIGVVAKSEKTVATRAADRILARYPDIKDIVERDSAALRALGDDDD